MIRNLNQYLKHRGGRWYYVRRIPQIYENVDKRRTIRKALRTSSLEVTRVRRDALAEADEEYWSSLVCLGELNGIDPNSVSAIQHYQSAKHRAMARGYIYSPVQQLAETNKLQDLIERIMHVGNQKKDKDQELEAEAILGGAEPPSIKISEALEIYYEKIAISAVLNKSPHQVKNWRKVKHRAVTNFIKQIGDLPMDEITRADARKFYLWWGERLKPKKDKPGLSGNSANRDLGNLRKIFREYWEYVGEEGRENPFRNLNFADIRLNDTPVFSIEWVRSKIIKIGVFKNLNREASLLVYGLIETGCRPSELANLLPENIKLDADIPYIEIKPRVDMEVKSRSSIRNIPLVGVSLEAFKASPNGFPHYLDNGPLLSSSLMKAFRTRKLFPTKEHRIYSFRHSFEKRMLETGLDFDLRCLLMGHKNSRPEYGGGGSMKFRRDELLKIVHPIPEGFIKSLKLL